MKRKKIIAGNWKMYKTAQEAETTIAEIANGINYNQQNDVWTATPFIYLQNLISRFGNTTIKFGAQNCYTKDEGAFTGEVSAKMLQSIHCSFVILGHSERRQYFFETDIIIHEKILAALNHNLLPVYCCGETLDQRNTNKHFEIVEQQIKEALYNLNADQISKIVIAYEPVWAIGTGVNATSEQAQEMHAYIRSLLQTQFGDAIADAIRILYGGSVKPNNATALFSQPDIDGGLIGGASLIAKDFLSIIESASE